MVIRRLPSVCLTININFVHEFRCRVIGRESSGGVPDYDYKWDMRVIIVTRCQGVTRDDGDWYFIWNLLIVILFSVYLCQTSSLSDRKSCNCYAMQLIESPCCQFFLCDNCVLDSDDLGVMYSLGMWQKSQNPFLAPPGCRMHPPQGSELLTELSALFGLFFWDGTPSSFLGVCHHASLSLIVRISKWGSKYLPIPIKTSTFIGLYPSATLAFITSTLGAHRLQILHVLEPALQLAQLSYRLQTFCCWISLSILI